MKMKVLKTVKNNGRNVNEPFEKYVAVLEEFGIPAEVFFDDLSRSVKRAAAEGIFDKETNAVNLSVRNRKHSKVMLRVCLYKPGTVVMDIKDVIAVERREKVKFDHVYAEGIGLIERQVLEELKTYRKGA